MDENGFGSWKVAVIGAETMGLCIAQHFAMQGNEVALYNRTPAHLDTALAHIRSNMEGLVRYGMAEEKDIDVVLSRISPTSDIATAVTSADYIVENVAEKPEVKQTVFAQIDAAAPPGAILASDISSMDIYQFINVSHPRAPRDHPLLQPRLRHAPGGGRARPRDLG